MKKSLKLILCGLGLFAITGLGFGLSLKQEIKSFEPTMVLAEGEEPETLPCHISIDPVQHGSVSVDIKEGNVGDICTITAKHDLLYKIDSVLVNGTALIESETTSGEFSFALVEGDNKITANFIVDEELCGALTTIVKQASEKDWTNLFSVENVVIIVKWVLDGGILIAMISYYVKDKRLEKKLEKRVESTLKDIIPETTKNTVLVTIEKVIEPMFGELKADYVEIMRGLNIFAKCMALSQENSVDSKRAILDELSGLKIGDLETINEVKRYVEEMVAKHNKTFEETLAAIKSIGESNAKIIEENKLEEDPPSEETVINKQPTE